MENAVPMADNDAVTAVIALGIPVRPEMPSTVSSMLAASVSSVVESVSSADRISSPPSVSGAPSPLKVVDEALGRAPDVVRRRLEPVLREVRRVGELPR